MSKKTLFDYFKSQGMNDYGVAGLMGNIQAESSFKACNLQSTGNKKLGLTDEEYTELVDNGTYTRDMFRKDGHGYGLVQWTYHTRKAGFYDFAKKKGVSVGNEEMQAEYIVKELKGYKNVWKTLCNAKSVREASDVVLLEYERPADQSEKVQLKRSGYGEEIYKEFVEAVKPKEEILYCVQVGAYSVKENAENMLAKVKRAGFDAFITTKKK